MNSMIYKSGTGWIYNELYAQGYRQALKDILKENITLINLIQLLNERLDNIQEKGMSSKA